MDAVRGLTEVGTRMRRLGHQVEYIPGWQTRGQGPPITPRGAVNHWTAGPRTGLAPTLRVVTYGRAGLRNALCNTYSSRHPKLYIVAACKAWHAGSGSWAGLSGNGDLGHEAESSGSGDWASGQLDLIADLDRVQCDVFGFPPSKVIDHFEWAPSRKVDRHDVGGAPWRALVARAASSTGATMFVRHGDRGEAVQYVQLLLADAGHPPDGGADEIFGDATAAALAAYWQDRQGKKWHGREVTAHVLRALHADVFAGDGGSLSSADERFLSEFVAEGRERDANPAGLWHVLDWLRNTRSFFLGRYS